MEFLHFFIWFQDLLILACSHPENRSSLIRMDEWPEWILEILISNYEVEPSTAIITINSIWMRPIFYSALSSHILHLMQTAGSKIVNLSNLRDVEDFIHNFLIIILEHSMRQKDGWKVMILTLFLCVTPLYLQCTFIKTK